MSGTKPGTTTDYLLMTLHLAMKTAVSFLTNIKELPNNAPPTHHKPQPAPVGDYIIAHPKKNSSQFINNILSVSDPTTYVMLATLT
jgi:hypothetical protein